MDNLKQRIRVIRDARRECLPRVVSDEVHHVSAAGILRLGGGPRPWTIDLNPTKLSDMLKVFLASQVHRNYLN
jgi:hypothetical protein